MSDKVTISGKVIQSTLETMETFGRLGKNVLKEYGITKIDEDNQYPYELRAAIHRVAFDRFGEVALRSFGFNHAEKFDLTLFQANSLAYQANEMLFKSKKKTDNYKGLENQIRVHCESSDRVIKIATEGVSGVNYGAKVHKLKEAEYVFEVTMALEMHQESFNRGAMEFVYAKYFGKYWNVEITFDRKNSNAAYGYSNLFWNINFIKKASNFSQEKIIWLKKSNLREALIQNVLDDAEKQKSKIEKLSYQIGKYLPPQIHQALLKGDYDTGITTRRKKLTIFFSDIKNFTSTSENLQPEDLTKYLNEYFSEMTEIAIKLGATIDKYIGDAMMVFFGDPDSRGEREDARACVEMALLMQEKMSYLKAKWLSEGFSDPFEVRMGLNTGYCNVGNFGSDQRLTYTIIGGEVNVAQRLEAAAEANGILMSYESYAHAEDMIKAEQQEAIKMKGISREIKVYSVKSRKRDKPKSDKPKIKIPYEPLSEVVEKERLSLIENNILELNKSVAQIKKLLEKNESK